MKINLNGKNKNILDKTTVFSLLKEENINAEVVAVVLNEEVLNRKDYEKIELRENDKLEVVSFVGGG